MKYTTLGKSGLLVSRLAFGAMTFGKGPLFGGLDSNITQKAADKMIGKCLDEGINFFDTADAYTSGQSEEILGKALAEKRDDVVIATKTFWRRSPVITDWGSSRRNIFNAIEKSLKRLGTDYVDLYIMHCSDPITPLDETCHALDDIVAKGMARYVAFSNYPAWRAQKAVSIQEMNGYTKFINAQMYYSLLGREIEHEVAPFCVDNGVGITAWSPLAGGFLTGKYTRKKPSPKGDRRSIFDFPPIDKDKGYDLIDELGKLARKHDASIAQISLAWVLKKSFIDSVIIGASKMKQLNDNIKSIDIELEDEDMQLLDQMTEPEPGYPIWFSRMGYDQAIVEGMGDRFDPAF